MTILEQVDIILSSTPIDKWSSAEIADIIGCGQNNIAENIKSLPYKVEVIKEGRTNYYRKVL